MDFNPLQNREQKFALLVGTLCCHLPFSTPHIKSKLPFIGKSSLI
jgi:hypothetical protein